MNYCCMHQLEASGKHNAVNQKKKVLKGISTYFHFKKKVQWGPAVGHSG